MKRVSLLVLTALLVTACVTRPAPTPTDGVIAHPAAVSLLRGFGVPDYVPDELLADLLVVQCSKPDGASKRDMQPALLRTAQTTHDTPALLTVEELTTVRMVESLLPANCEPAQGNLADFPVTPGTDHWSGIHSETDLMRHQLRAALGPSLTEFLGYPVEVEYATDGVVRVATAPGGGDPVPPRDRACELVKSLPAVMALLGLAPVDAATLLGDHDPPIQVTVAAGPAPFVLDSAPGRLSDALFVCVTEPTP